ncbi:MAG: MBL fold metallo-hydrolase [bacterium]|nr:MBL fold metallo-hydrolase [bacterium]
MTAPRISSAVLLTRGTGEDYEIYLVRRAPSLRFFGGYWALPGGVVDPVDHDGEERIDEDDTHRRCAARELFEETGVLPAPLAAALGDRERRTLRSQLLTGGDPAPFRALLDAHPAATDELVPFARLTTPPFAPLRYRTRFLHFTLPPGEEPTIISGELTAGRFGRPGELVDAWIAGEELIVPPAVGFLRRMRGRTLDAFLGEIDGVCRDYEAGTLAEVRNTPGVWMVPLETPTIPPATTTNCYVVGHGRLFVVDPATYDAAERRRLFDFLDLRRDEGRTLAGVLATHHHPDHVGSINAVAARYGLPVFAHPRTLERLPAGFDDGRPLRDGDALELGEAPDGTLGWRLTAYHTPGHDQGHLVFVESRYGAAIVGDLCSTVSTIVIDPPEGHMATYLASLERMRHVPMGVLYPAHGSAHRDGHELLAQYLEHRAGRERKLLAALSDVARGDAELLSKVYDDVRESILPLAARSLAAGLEKLEAEGRARRIATGWISAD